VQVAKTSFQQELLNRALVDPGERIPVATPEDIIVLKLISWRDKDEIGLRAMARFPSLNWAYVEHWAGVWDVAGRQKRLRPSPTESVAVARDYPDRPALDGEAKELLAGLQGSSRSTQATASNASGSSPRLCRRTASSGSTDRPDSGRTRP